MRHLCRLFIAFACLLAAAHAEPRLAGITYPYPVHLYHFEAQRQPLEMAYMDVPAQGTERGVVVLLHGKNFSGSYFGETAAALSNAGYRVILPDQIGFGKSSKPAHFQYSFQQLATQTHDLLRSLGVKGPVHLLGHSMGGMVATRYALMFPGYTVSLTLLNPIGLEDWKALGVPYPGVDAWYHAELHQTRAQLKAYQLEAYYDGQWKAAYDPWLDQLAAFLDDPDYPRMAWNQALTYDMIYTQPVVHEFGDLKVPTLLIIGQRDRTALGKNLVAPELRAKLGNYPALGRAAQQAIPGAQLVELEGLGHLPHVEAFDRFFPPYRAFLDAQAKAEHHP